MQSLTTAGYSFLTLKGKKAMSRLGDSQQYELMAGRADKSCNGLTSRERVEKYDRNTGRMLLALRVH